MLSLEQEGESVRRLEGLTGAEAALFAEAYWRHRPAYDRGLVSGDVYWRRVGGELGVELSAVRIVELVREDAVSWVRLNERMMTWLLAPRFGHVEHLTLSFEVGAAKPEPAIYLRCLESLGIEPAEALFVDDRRENVEAGRALGMEAVLFEGEDALAAELERRGLDWPLP